MPIENKYVNAESESNSIQSAISSGTELVYMTQTFEISDLDDDASIYRIFKNVHAHLVPVEIKIVNDAIAGGTDFDFGIYEPNKGIVKIVDALADGVDLSAARAVGSDASLLSAIDVADLGKKVFELAGDVMDQGSLSEYDLALTANVVGTAAGTVTVSAIFARN